MIGAPKILFLGMAGPLSTGPLQWLIDNGFAPHQVAVPAHLLGREASPLELPVERPTVTCAQVARRYAIPVVGVTRDWSTRLAEYGCDMLLSACWPWRLPASILDAYPAAAFNLHPSLLPQFRGPAPLFWQLRQGVDETGITLHALGPEFDSGPVFGQERLAIAVEDTEDTLRVALAALSGTLLARWLRACQEGITCADSEDESAGSYYPMPGAADFVVPAQWSARRAYRFIHGTASWKRPFQIEVDGGRLRVQNAIAYFPGKCLTVPWQASARGFNVQFADGVLALQAT